MVAATRARQCRAMSEVKWLPAALADFERLHHFIYQKSPDAAARAANAILDGANLLKTSPAMGRPMADGTGRREIYIPFNATAYVLRYRIEHESTAVIIRVWHSKEERA